MIPSCNSACLLQPRCATRGKLGIRVCKRTIQKYMRTVRTPQPRGQKWATFLRNHAAQIWACDFLQGTDLFFRPLFAFFIIKLKSRKVIHVGVTRSPTDPWVAQHLREATPYGQAPKYLMCDNDSKFGPCFARVATTSGLEILKTPYHAPRANAICERFLTHELRNESYLRSPTSLSHADVSRKSLRQRVPVIKEVSSSLTAHSAVPQPSLDILSMFPIVVNIEDASQRSAECPPIGLQEPGFRQLC